MKRSVRCDCSIISGENEFVIELGLGNVVLLVLELSMLMMGLIKQLNIVFNSGDGLCFLLDENLKAEDKAVVSQRDKCISIALSRNQLEYIYTSLLRVYKEQIALVNHIHIECSKDSEAYDLTLMFENVSEPLTPKEASKLIGD